MLVLGTERLCWPASALNSPALHLSAWTSVRALVVWVHPHSSSASISRVSSGFVPSHFIDSCQCFLKEMLHLFLSFRGFPLRTEAVKQQQIPMELGGLPKSDLDSQRLLCSQVFLPRLPFNYIFEGSVDPIQGHFGPFLPLCNSRLSQRLFFPNEGNCKIQCQSTALPSGRRRKTS